MKDPADGVVCAARGGEGTMAALVGENPDAGADHTLEDTIDGPAEEAERR